MEFLDVSPYFSRDMFWPGAEAIERPTSIVQLYIVRLLQVVLSRDFLNVHVRGRRVFLVTFVPTVATGLLGKANCPGKPNSVRAKMCTRINVSPSKATKGI